MIKGEPILILFVEDEPAHAEIAMRSFSASRVANRVIHLQDGQQALDYLFRTGEFADPSSSPRPHLILLDLRLPKVDGLEVLAKAKSDSELKNIPVVILTTSTAEIDIARAYGNYANSYLVKPLNFDNFTKLLETLNYYWVAWNIYPH